MYAAITFDMGCILKVTGSWELYLKRRKTFSSIFARKCQRNNASAIKLCFPFICWLWRVQLWFIRICANFILLFIYHLNQSLIYLSIQLLTSCHLFPGSTLGVGALHCTSSNHIVIIPDINYSPLCMYFDSKSGGI